MGRLRVCVFGFSLESLQTWFAERTQVLLLRRMTLECILDENLNTHFMVDATGKCGLNNSFFPNHTPCLVSDFRGPFSIKFDISFDVPRWLESLMAHWPDSTFYECAHLESHTFTCHCPFPASQSIASGTWLQLGAAMDQARLGWATSKPIRFIWFASVQLYKKLDTEPTR